MIRSRLAQVRKVVLPLSSSRRSTSSRHQTINHDMILPFLCCQLPNPLFVVVEQLEYLSLCMLSRMGSLHERGMCTRRPLLWQLPKQESGEFSILFSLSPRAVRPTLSRPPWVLPLLLPFHALACTITHPHTVPPEVAACKFETRKNDQTTFAAPPFSCSSPLPHFRILRCMQEECYTLPFTTRAKIRNRYGIWHVRRQGKCKKKIIRTLFGHPRSVERVGVRAGV